MALDFSKIDKTVDLKGLQADVEEAKKNGGGDFPTCLLYTSPSPRD